MKTRTVLTLMLLLVSLASAAAEEFVGNEVTPYGTFRGVPYELHKGRFEGTTSLGFYSMPYEIVIPEAPHRGNHTLFIEPPHFLLVAAARDWVLGPELLFDRGFSYGTVGYGNDGGNRLDFEAEGLFLGGVPFEELPPFFLDFELLLQFTEALSERLQSRRTYAYGFSQTAATLGQILFARPGLDLFDLTLLHVTPFPDGWEFVPFQDVGKVVFVGAEGDQIVFGSEAFDSAAHEPDHRVYEVAGAAHAVGPTNPLDHWMVMRAIFVQADRWVRWGRKPPKSSVLEHAPAGEIDPVYGFETGIARDADGNARGGVRLPDLHVGRAQYIASDPSVAPVPLPVPGLFGSMVDLSCEPEPRFRNHPDYVRQVVQQAVKLWKKGFLLADDVKLLIEEAKASDVGNCP